MNLEKTDVGGRKQQQQQQQQHQKQKYAILFSTTTHVLLNYLQKLGIKFINIFFAGFNKLLYRMYQDLDLTLGKEKR